MTLQKPFCEILEASTLTFVPIVLRRASYLTKVVASKPDSAREENHNRGNQPSLFAVYTATV